MNKVLELKNVSKKFHTLEGEVFAIKNISFNVYENEILGIVGSSGCGKSTILNIISGLEAATSGSINNQNLNYSYMLQSDALLPWLNVLDNACIGLDKKNENG